MAHRHGRLADVYIRAYEVSGDLNDLTWDISTTHPEHTTFADTYIQRSASGMGDWTMTHNGFYNDVTTNASPGIEEIAQILRSSSGISVEAYLGGATACKRGYAGETNSVDYSVNSPIDNMVTYNGTVSGSDALYAVRSLAGKQTSSCTATASAYANVDFSAAMERTCKGFLRVFSGSATTNPSGLFVIQHSNDQSSYSDLITFNTATGSFHEVQSVTSASRYIRFTRNISDGGGNNAQFTFHVGFGPEILA